jgi:predicted RNase H-like nuclease (RuvC/YqgF family)
MNNQTPEALRLADELDDFNSSLDRKCAKELRRLHALTQQQADELALAHGTIESRDRNIETLLQVNREQAERIEALEKTLRVASKDMKDLYENKDNSKSYKWSMLRVAIATIDAAIAGEKK